MFRIIENELHIREKRFVRPMLTKLLYHTTKTDASNDKKEMPPLKIKKGVQIQ